MIELIMLCFLFLPVKTVYANVQILPQKATYMSIYKSVEDMPQSDYYRLPSKITSVSSSNPKVADIEKDGAKFVAITPYQVGTTKLTVKCGRKIYLQV